MHDASVTLLAVAAVKATIWLAILVVAARQRRLLPLAYAPLGVIATLARGLDDAHVALPDWAPQIAAFVSTPIACLILASLLVTEPTTRARSGGQWSL